MNVFIHKMSGVGYLLQKNNKMVGMVHISRGGDFSKHYVTCFEHAWTSEYVLRGMNKIAPKICVERTGPDMDITAKVREKMKMRTRMRNKDTPYKDSSSSIVVNTMSKLFIEKKIDDECVGDPDDMSTKEIAMSDILMMPYESNVGVILSRTLIWEDDMSFVFDCTILEPSVDPDLARVLLSCSL